MGPSRFSVDLRGRAARARGVRPGLGAVRLRVSAVAGPAWTRSSGVRTAVSQSCAPSGGDFHIELPIDVAYESDTPFGWPQLTMTLYGANARGVETAVGHARVHFPTTRGERRVSAPLFAPEPSTGLGSRVSELTGKTPELINPDSIADGVDNYLLRTTSCGYVELFLNLVTKGMTELDYDNVPGVCNGRIEE